MKNRYLILLAGLLVAGSMLLVACGDKNDKPADTKAPTAAQTDPATDPAEETTAPEADTTVAEDDTTVAEDDTTVAEDDTTVAEDGTTVAEDDTTVAEDDTTETDAEPVLPMADPVYLIDLGHMVQMAGSSQPIHAQHTSALVAEEWAYITLIATGADPYIAAVEMNDDKVSVPATSRLYIVYRTETESAPEFFIGSGDQTHWTGGVDHLDGEAYIADGEWHLMAVDLSSVSAFDGITANYLRFDYFTSSGGTEVPVDAFIDIKMVAFFNNDEEAQSYASALYGMTFDTEDTQPEETQPEQTLPEETQPEQALPEETQPEAV